MIFESQKVDLVILEVGMGGRLDATNGIPSSSVVLSIITSIDLDHQAFLGNTVQAIAREKAGIIRCGGRRDAVSRSQVDENHHIREWLLLPLCELASPT